MSPRLSTYAMLWRAAFVFAHPHRAAFYLWGTALLVAASLVFGLMYADARTALVWACALVPGSLLLVWAMNFVPIAVKLNTPANARLVPQARLRLMELTYLIWLACIVAIALNPHKETAMVSYGLFWVAVTALGVALSASGNQLGIGVIIATSFGSIYAKFLPGWLNSSAAAPAFLVAEVAVFALVGALVVRMMFPQGGEAHWKLNERRKRVSSVESAQDSAEAARHASASILYLRALRRHCARRDTRALVLHALGPLQHIGIAAVSIAVAVAVGAALLVFARNYSEASAEAASTLGIFPAFVLLVFVATEAWRPSFLMRGTPVEQALVRLAPAMPATARAFNRHLAHALLRQILIVWAMAAIGIMLLTWLSGASRTVLLGAACVCFLMLPAVAMPLRDHARRSSLAPVVAFLTGMAALICIAGGVVGLGFGWPALPVVAACALLLAAAALARGLRVMEAAPCAFPAGRLD